ncbi:MAG: sugar transferase [Syntrophorhabdaceae bacterium]|nr:sugar transferase [Syntrophorhabdaceae bacterium]
MSSHRAIKRAIDIILSVLILVMSLPLMGFVALLILALEGRPVIYVSRRLVSADRMIRVYKFRTMARDATSRKYCLKERFMRDGYLDIPRDCEVYTPIGRVLERLQIVELPQMVNILFHGMSLIGNRPLPSENVNLLRQFDGSAERFDSPAGITGIAQVAGRMNITPHQRLELERAYSRMYREGNILWCDLKIFFCTLYMIVFAKGISLDRAYNMVGIEPKTSDMRPMIQTSVRV